MLIHGRICVRTVRAGASGGGGDGQAWGPTTWSIRAESSDHSTACQVRPGTDSKARRKRPMPAAGSRAWTVSPSRGRLSTSGATTRATSFATLLGV